MAVAASHISVISQAPPETASPMNFVESADQAYASPALKITRTGSLRPGRLSA